MSRIVFPVTKKAISVKNKSKTENKYKSGSRFGSRSDDGALRWKYDTRCMGKWYRAKVLLLKAGMSVLAYLDANNSPRILSSVGEIPLPPVMKVTDLIKHLLQLMGHTSAEYDIPDLPIKLFGLERNAYRTAPLQTADRLLQEIIRTHLLHYLYWEDNAGTNGKWELRAPPKATDEPVCKFVLPDERSNPQQKLPLMNLQSYTRTPIPECPIIFGSYTEETYPPEFNVLTVTMEGAVLDNGQFTQYSVTAVNPVSANFNLGVKSKADPNDRSFLGFVKEVVVVLPVLTYTASAEEMQSYVRRIARRIFTLGARAVRTCTFSAPLVLVDMPETEKYADDVRKRRPLRFGDSVLVMGEKWVITDVGIQFRKDKNIIATYQCELPQRITEVPV